MQLKQYIDQNTTVTEFAKRINRSRAQVHRYILGQNLTKSIIEEICEATEGQVTPADFFAVPQETAA